MKSRDRWSNFSRKGKLAKVVGARGLVALERLMGMLLVAISVEMMLSGIRAAQTAAQAP